jgi:hypothetical protein
MFFNKWKKRAYAELEKNEFLEEDLLSHKSELERLYKTITIMESNPTCNHILDLRMEAAMDNKPATKVYLTHEQQMDIYADVGTYLKDKGSINMIYGLRVFTTQKNMRVE